MNLCFVPSIQRKEQDKHLCLNLSIFLLKTSQNLSWIFVSFSYSRILNKKAREQYVKKITMALIQQFSHIGVNTGPQNNMQTSFFRICGTVGGLFIVVFFCLCQRVGSSTIC